MRTLISNLNVIRATRVSGLLCNGFGRISTVVVNLSERLAEFPWSAHPADHRERRESLWKPLYASVGSTPVDLGSDKRMCLSLQMDQTCPSLSRLWGRPQMTRFAVVPGTVSPRTANRTSKGYAAIG